MKVLVASHSYIVDLNCEKLRTLAHMGHDVTVVVPKRWNPGGVQNRIVEPQPRQEDSFRVVPIANLSQNNQGLLSFGWGLIELLKTFKPDIIQVEQGSKSLGYAELITLNRLLGNKAKNLFFTWWNLPYEVKFPLSWLEAYNLRHTDGLVVGNQDGANILKDHGYQGPVRVMPQLGVDETLFCPKEQPQLRQQLDISDDRFVVGFVGRFVPEKGLVTLLKALATLTNLPWTLVLLGRGPLKQDLQNQAQTLGIAQRIRWIESVPHDAVPDYINLMDSLVLPSETTYEFKTLTSVGWKEQFGHVLIEAMACQVPVIGSDSGEIPYVIDDSGLVFPEGDHQALADRLSQLIQQPDIHQTLAKKGYARALQRYTNKALATELLAFYQELLAA
ncbi:glycosyl transferase family 1 [Leptolyngbya sp. Heron Island J]|uniref:hormogonium polysaccharide biosynthesis glycosyltransferase HpsO n=1 Tax=Leptolyngbya sp. Heron Island J TaxID=1385935 RepID=UPI0003B9462D|nr:hormogonium polysaccharide biosynthesis glycosyltransferase HpsO [Leptolyngbya sp. Heron Island J]ESA34147.1 glycosyl transferase family 1 [Leptolyngbya sp. Heron Island J]